jgi:hypothetical protein
MELSIFVPKTYGDARDWRGVANETPRKTVILTPDSQSLLFEKDIAH